MVRRSTAADNYYRQASESRRSSSSSTVGSQKPLFLTCYLCGQGYGRHSLPIHQPQCYAKKLVEWERSDPTKRGPPPQHPTDVPSCIPAYSSEDTIQAFNEVQKHIFRKSRKESELATTRRGRRLSMGESGERPTLSPLRSRAAENLYNENAVWYRSTSPSCVSPVRSPRSVRSDTSRSPRRRWVRSPSPSQNRRNSTLSPKLASTSPKRRVQITVSPPRVKFNAPQFDYSSNPMVSTALATTQILQDKPEAPRQQPPQPTQHRSHYSSSLSNKELPDAPTSTWGYPADRQIPSIHILDTIQPREYRFPLADVEPPTVVTTTTTYHSHHYTSPLLDPPTATVTDIVSPTLLGGPSHMDIVSTRSYTGAELAPFPILPPNLNLPALKYSQSWDTSSNTNWSTPLDNNPPISSYGNGSAPSTPQHSHYHPTNTNLEMDLPPLPSRTETPNNLLSTRYDESWSMLNDGNMVAIESRGYMDTSLINTSRHNDITVV